MPSNFSRVFHSSLLFFKSKSFFSLAFTLKTSIVRGYAYYTHSFFFSLSQFGTLIMTRRIERKLSVKNFLFSPPTSLIRRFAIVQKRVLLIHRADGGLTPAHTLFRTTGGLTPVHRNVIPRTTEDRSYTMLPTVKLRVSRIWSFPKLPLLLMLFYAL